MNLPRNGSRAANGTLFAAGIFLGVVLTMMVYRPGSGNSPDRPGDSGSAGHPRHLALPPDAGGEETEGRELLEAALAVSDPQQRAEAMRQAGAAAARQDIQQALREGLSLLSAQDRLDYHRGIFGSWAESDPQAALEHAHGSFAAGMLQSESIGIAINRWGSENPREAWVWAEQHLTGPLKERALTDLMIGWTRRSPTAAADWMKHSGLLSQPVINAVARTWAEQAPRAAADWARTLPAGEARQTAETAVAAEWASQDPPAAVAHFEDQLQGEAGLNIAIALTDVWGTSDPAATAAWLESLPAASNRAEAAGVLSSIWGASDIEAAVAWSAGLEDAAMRRKVITHLGTTWGALEPAAALAWLTSLPQGEAADGITGAFYSWAGTNPATMQEWIAAAPPSATADRARRSLGDVLTASAPSRSLDLALGISDPARQAEAAGRFFREWRKNDEASAQEWIQNRWNTLPAAVQDRLAVEQGRAVVPR